uniref:V-SNARE coiled-coil homology domain-containing protein n=2 Tax=Spongospora subterranea TaxID=70186 RepID=A0A0H5RBJ8_9EUKA|eukprot:CRZ05824.1 hypothetical protein [Spongospora subterranea]
MGNSSGFKPKVDQETANIPAPDNFFPCNLKKTDVVFAPIGRLGVGRCITSMAYDTSERILAVGTSSGMVMIIASDTIQTILRIADGNSTRNLHFLRDVKLFVITDAGNELWNWSTGSRLVLFDAIIPCSIPYLNSFILFGSDDGQVETFDAENGRLSSYIVTQPSPAQFSDVSGDESGNRPHDRHNSRTHVAAVAEDGNSLWIAYSNYSIRQWDLKQRKDTGWYTSPDPVSLLAIEPSSARQSARFACSGSNGRVIIWNKKSTAPCSYLQSSESSEISPPAVQLIWSDHGHIVVLRADAPPSISVYNGSDYSLTSQISGDIVYFLPISSAESPTLIASSSLGEVFLTRLEPSSPRSIVVSSDFSQCVAFTMTADPSLISWLTDLKASTSPTPLQDSILKGGVASDSKLSPCILITASPKRTLSFWDLTSPFAAVFLSDLDVNALCDAFDDRDDDLSDITFLKIFPDISGIAIGFSNGNSLLIQYQTSSSPGKFYTRTFITSHSHPVVGITVSAILNRIAVFDAHSVSLSSMDTGELVFAVQIARISSLFFCDIENMDDGANHPLKPVLLIGTWKCEVIALDAITGNCLNQDFTPLADSSRDHWTTPSPSKHAIEGDNSAGRFLKPRRDVNIAGIVGLHGNHIPLQTLSESNSVYISPRLLVGIWNASIRVCEIDFDGASKTWMLKSLCEIRHDARFLCCWIITIDENSSAFVAIDELRRLQVRRLMDVDTLLLSADIPVDIRTEDISKMVCTSDGRLLWKTVNDEMVVSMLFMDCLRKIQAPVISAGDNGRSAEGRGTRILSSLSKVIKGASIVDLLQEERKPEPKPEEEKSEVVVADENPLAEVTAKARENLDKLRETADTSKNLNNAAMEFMNTAKLLSEKNKSSWF